MNKTLLLVVSCFFLAMAAPATPIAVGLGLYDWVANDLEFKVALWEGFKSWVTMIVVGLGVGFPCYVASSAAQAKALTKGWQTKEDWTA